MISERSAKTLALLSTQRARALLTALESGKRSAGELAAAGVRPRLHLGHDLDADNLTLLRRGVLHAVLHHDLRTDLARLLKIN